MRTARCFVGHGELYADPRFWRCHCARITRAGFKPASAENRLSSGNQAAPPTSTAVHKAKCAARIRRAFFPRMHAAAVARAFTRRCATKSASLTPWRPLLVARCEPIRRHRVDQHVSAISYSDEAAEISGSLGLRCLAQMPVRGTPMATGPQHGSAPRYCRPGRRPISGVAHRLDRDAVSPGSPRRRDGRSLGQRGCRDRTGTRSGDWHSAMAPPARSSPDRWGTKAFCGTGGGRRLLAAQPK